MAALLFAHGAPSAPGAARPTDLLGGTPVASLPAEAAALAPEIAAPAGVLVDPEGRVLWAREPDATRAMASTTKIMTAVIALERGTLDDEVEVSARAAGIGESAAKLRQGARYPMRTLLEATLVRSGNDASIAIAEHVAGSVEAFATLMNERAEELGMERTRFANPHGLDAEGHHTSAVDLATLARHAMSIPEFRRMVALESTFVDSVDGRVELENSNLLIGTLEGATGVKTGWTGRAGYCLVASAEREGLELFAVILGADNEMERFRQAGLLLEWGFVHYTEERLADTGELVGSVPVTDYLDERVDAIVAQPARIRVFTPAGPVDRSLSLEDGLRAPVAAGDRIGTLSFVQGDRLLAQVPVVAASDVRRPSLPERAWIALVRAWRSVFGAPEPAPA